MDAVLFDLFGTLIPNLPVSAIDEALEDVARILDADREAVHAESHRQFPLRMNGTLRDGPLQFQELADSLGIRATESQLHDAARAWRSTFDAHFRLKEDALHTVQELRARGFLLGLVTDCSSNTNEMFESTPLAPHFDACAYSALLGITKPDPRMYRHVTEQLDVEHDRCTYVGDGNSHELRGARGLGMTTVWVDNGADQHWHTNFCSEADHSVTELTQLTALLEQLSD